jgi:hypothetical protein
MPSAQTFLRRSLCFLVAHLSHTMNNVDSRVSTNESHHVPSNYEAATNHPSQHNNEYTSGASPYGTTNLTRGHHDASHRAESNGSERPSKTFSSLRLLSFLPSVCPSRLSLYSHRADIVLICAHHSLSVHDSRAANKLDPRVDTDRTNPSSSHFDGSSLTHGNGHSLTGSHLSGAQDHHHVSSGGSSYPPFSLARKADPPSFRRSCLVHPSHANQSTIGLDAHSTTGRDVKSSGLTGTGTAHEGSSLSFADDFLTWTSLTCHSVSLFPMHSSHTAVDPRSTHEGFDSRGQAGSNHQTGGAFEVNPTHHNAHTGQAGGSCFLSSSQSTPSLADCFLIRQPNWSILPKP